MEPGIADDQRHAMTEDTWKDVIAAMDRTYLELVDYQELLEKQNRELDDMRQFMASVLSSVSDLLIVVDKTRSIVRTGGAIRDILGADAAAEVGAPLASLLQEAGQSPLLEVIDQVMLSREPAIVEVAFATHDGSTPLEISVSPAGYAWAQSGRGFDRATTWRIAQCLFRIGGQPYRVAAGSDTIGAKRKACLAGAVGGRGCA